MSDPITLPGLILDIPGPPADKWEREYRAFRRLLPSLLSAHRGKYVAVREEQVVASGDDKVALALSVYAQYGYVTIYVGLVSESPIARVRIPHYRLSPESSRP
jgi:hypothetical protein